MSDDPSLGAAYALQSPDENLKLYARWAESYDTSFVAENDYVLHLAVAKAFAALGRGPVLDIGAGTGICGAALRTLGVSPVDGTDISTEMLAEADAKQVYRRAVWGDILAGLDEAEGA